MLKKNVFNLENWKWKENWKNGKKTEKLSLDLVV